MTLWPVSVNWRRQAVILAFAILAAFYWTRKQGLFTDHGNASTNETWLAAKKAVMRRIDHTKFDVVDGTTLSGLQKLLILTKSTSDQEGARVAAEMVPAPIRKRDQPRRDLRSRDRRGRMTQPTKMRIRTFGASLEFLKEWEYPVEQQLFEQDDPGAMPAHVQQNTATKQSHQSAPPPKHTQQDIRDARNPTRGPSETDSFSKAEL
mmetsp:Transcript_18952/g.44433  ORF Transcript_18952/g.44433 Transcript_18952/m.44433 type:complete len:206 (-) Transcript_18952:72-689(-)